MPEFFPSPLEDRCSALENFKCCKTQCPPSHCRKMQCPHFPGRSQPAKASSDRHKAAISTPNIQHADPPILNSDGHDRSTTHRRRSAKRKSEAITPKNKPHSKSPRSSSSVHYGVRFRHDLKKWVAEIRVAQWKAVDKKVWLGTFHTEDAAARGVDLARKLLKCKKKRRFNLPCAKLEVYSTTIPPNLILTDVGNEQMFKDVVQFIKNECQKYAASFPAPQPHFPDHETLPAANTLLAHDEIDLHYGPTDSHELPHSSVEDAMEVLSIDDYQCRFGDLWDSFGEKFSATHFGSRSASSSAGSDSETEQMTIDDADAQRETVMQLQEERDMEARELVGQEWAYLLQAGPGPALTPSAIPGSQSEEPLYICFDDSHDFAYFDFNSHWSLQGKNDTLQFNFN